ncbi:unnamed protein product [Psylliodes chrysocephalus]|uniref:Uncharacterized protein n=1 Tax=Psylliodes chrysocephalus TaxID=3402493 RepID=A0A9P0CVD6_9CUCU|nr:unnamed protein product [Psylliodes chrysocephala]
MTRSLSPDEVNELEVEYDIDFYIVLLNERDWRMTRPTDPKCVWAALSSPTHSGLQMFLSGVKDNKHFSLPYLKRSLSAFKIAPSMKITFDQTTKPCFNKKLLRNMREDYGLTHYRAFHLGGLGGYVTYVLVMNTSSIQIAKKLTPVTPAPEAPTPKSKSTYFEKLDVAVRMELDLRFPLQYIMYTTAETYPDLTVKSHPFTKNLYPTSLPGSKDTEYALVLFDDGIYYIASKSEIKNRTEATVYWKKHKTFHIAKILKESENKKQLIKLTKQYESNMDYGLVRFDSNIYYIASKSKIKNRTSTEASVYWKKHKTFYVAKILKESENKKQLIKLEKQYKSNEMQAMFDEESEEEVGGEAETSEKFSEGDEEETTNSMLNLQKNGPSYSSIAISRRELYDILTNSCQSKIDDQFKFITSYLKERTGCPDTDLKDINSKIYHFKLEFKSRWLNVGRSRNRFLKKYDNWLDTLISFTRYTQSISIMRGRPTVPFEDSRGFQIIKRYNFNISETCEQI